MFFLNWYVNTLARIVPQTDMVELPYHFLPLDDNGIDYLKTPCLMCHWSAWFGGGKDWMGALQHPVLLGLPRI